MKQNSKVYKIQIKMNSNTIQTDINIARVMSAQKLWDYYMSSLSSGIEIIGKSKKLNVEQDQTFESTVEP